MNTTTILEKLEQLVNSLPFSSAKIDIQNVIMYLHEGYTLDDNVRKAEIEISLKYESECHFCQGSGGGNFTCSHCGGSGTDKHGNAYLKEELKKIE